MLISRISELELLIINAPTTNITAPNQNSEENLKPDA